LEKERNRPYLDGVNFPRISQEVYDMLVASFEEAKIKEVIWDCEISKSLRSDGFNLKFIKASWSLLKEDVKRFLRKFHVNGVFPRGRNASFITLIPKIEDPQNLGDFRSISLVGCMYKILAKILA